ncbi:hypothetical protein ACQPZQ_15745 [Pseudonocardia sp. CA-142604]|uniref:hypothetical protein n=1 Tax=Pseudonocardia sp. CA-142604 TaxID=3240024 RepID=UPI003D8FFDA1
MAEIEVESTGPASQRSGSGVVKVSVCLQLRPSGGGRPAAELISSMPGSGNVESLMDRRDEREVLDRLLKAVRTGESRALVGAR